MSRTSCFKAYDIRGKVGEELTNELAYQIGGAFASHIKPRKVVVGCDARISSESLKASLCEGLIDCGVDVIDIGLAGTEEVYFATPHFDADGGICVTASHNPIEYNGMKMVKRDSVPISNDSGLLDIKNLVENNKFQLAEKQGMLTKANIVEPFVSHILNYIDLNLVAPMRLVVNAGNGVAGHVIDKIEEFFNRNSVPIEFVKLHHEPDGLFPNGIPNPLLPENREPTRKAVIETGADLGIAWDGDFDRCFFFDENGCFVEGYYIVGLLAEAFLEKSKGEKIIHDPRVLWNTQELVAESGGQAVVCKTGHAFIKERMRQEDAVYGGEMSAHHYFRDFWYCDSGMIPWLLIVELLSRKKTTLSEMVGSRVEKFPSSGEINRSIGEPIKALEKMEQAYKSKSVSVDKTDGLSMEFDNWRFNLRCSNTEPVVRLNVESRGDSGLVQSKTKEILNMLDSF